MGQALFYTGSYALKDQAGIKAMTLQLEDGGIVQRAALAGMHHPSFLAVNKAGTRLYAVSETGEEPAAY